MYLFPGTLLVYNQLTPLLQSRLSLRDSHLLTLHQTFVKQSYTGPLERSCLAESMNVSKEIVHRWFEHHRSKPRRDFPSGKHGGGSVQLKSCVQ